MDTKETFDRLMARLKKVAELDYMGALLRWDQEVNAPRNGFEGRGQIIAAVAKERTEIFITAETGDLLSALSERLNELTLIRQLLVKRVAQDYHRAKAIPPEFVARFAEAESRAYPAWRQARQDSNFSLFEKALEEMVKLTLEAAALYGYDGHPYDALLPDYEPSGITAADLKKIFVDLRKGLVPFLNQLLAQPNQPNQALLRGEFSHDRQEKLCRRLLEVYGFDFNRGRVDFSDHIHPFCIAVGPDDHRIISRFKPGQFVGALLGCAHECGHSSFNRGMDAMFAWAKPSISYALHESQSRLWENMVGRSRPFWNFFYPELQKVFHDFTVSFDDFYRAINTVKRSLIRVDADEVTYNLHIMVRFELELALLGGELLVKDLPEAWNEKMLEYLGVAPEKDADGVLQDVHWSGGALAYFPTYALGNFYAAQIFAAAKDQIADLEEEISVGNLCPLLDWLREKVHNHGFLKDTPDLILKITGEEPSAKAWLDYIRQKYSEIYKL